MAKMLSPNFSLDELVFSQTAARLGIDNTPDAQVLKNLKHLASQLELVRSALGDVPILVSSGYRSDAVNIAVGGAAGSQHRSGLAVDFTAPKFGTVLQTAKAVAACGVAFDQVIYEFGKWVHLGVAAPDTVAKSQTLSIMVAGQYVGGLKNVA
jgi:zinc D-Ala-D-Ala carboxypeptidase